MGPFASSICDFISELAYIRVYRNTLWERPGQGERPPQKNTPGDAQKLWERLGVFFIFLFFSRPPTSEFAPGCYFSDFFGHFFGRPMGRLHESKAFIPATLLSVLLLPLLLTLLFLLVHIKNHSISLKLRTTSVLLPTNIWYDLHCCHCFLNAFS